MGLIQFIWKLLFTGFKVKPVSEQNITNSKKLSTEAKESLIKDYVKNP